MTTITIQKIYPPKQEGWSASIKASTGSYFGIKESLVQGLSEGMTIEADTVSKEKNGKTYTDIVKVHGSQRSGSPLTAKAAYKPTDDATAERIFVCGLVNAVAPKIYEKGGNLTSEQLSALVQVARATWAQTLGRKPTDEPSDEIGF
jgi:hypothetical protein